MWITIKVDDVKTRLAGPELAAYSNAARASGQTDPLPEIIAGVVAEVRNAIAQNTANRLGIGATIPPGALHHALAMVRYRLISRLPVDMKETRRAEYEDALAWLRSKPLVEQPDEAAANQLTTSSPAIAPKTKPSAWEDGL